MKAYFKCGHNGPCHTERYGDPNASRITLLTSVLGSSWVCDVLGMFWQFVRTFGAVEHYFGHAQNYFHGAPECDKCPILKAFEVYSRKWSFRKGL